MFARALAGYVNFGHSRSVGHYRKINLACIIFFLESCSNSYVDPIIGLIYHFSVQLSSEGGFGATRTRNPGSTFGKTRKRGSKKAKTGICKTEAKSSIFIDNL